MAWAVWVGVGVGFPLNGPLGVPERPMCEPEGGPLLLPPLVRLLLLLHGIK